MCREEQKWEGCRDRHYRELDWWQFRELDRGQCRELDKRQDKEQKAPGPF